MSDPLLDVNEAAEYLTVSRATLYREVKRGKLVAVKVGASTRFRRSELERYIRAGERRSVA
jgi:excisionase family DNA binding protein